jgi:CMP-N-acetylneuraminic acid synthetase
MNVDALIPARGGSRRLPGKHLLELGGRPLVDWTLAAAREAGIFRRACLSSDDAALRERALVLGLDIFPPRPADLASDDSPSTAVVSHYLDWCRDQGLGEPDWLMLLQPTSPLRGSARVCEAWELACAHDSEVVSLGPLEKPLGWCRQVQAGRALSCVLPDPAPLWRLNGAIYLIRVERFRREGTLLSAGPLALCMEGWESVDVDTLDDLLLARALRESRFGRGGAA